MDKILYDMMDWAGIEELVYSEASNPHGMLGPHVTEQGLLIQAFMPTAEKVSVKLNGKKEYPMSLMDDPGFFAVLIPRKTVTEYTLVVAYDNGATEEIQDPYAYGPQFKEEELKKFEAGIYYDVYEKMGAHTMEIKGVKGVYFAVWAPCAMRVSVVGDFNMWDGRRHQMRKLGDSGVFELFIPGLDVGTVYKYEVKAKNGDAMLKADPYGNYAELRPANASIVWDISRYQWTDDVWMKNRAKEDKKDKPMSIYEMHLGSWIRKPIEVDEDGKEIAGSEFYNYREIAVKLADYVKEMGYTHVELMPVMEHPLDASWGYQVTGYYAPTSRYGTPDDFQYFVDYLHGQGIGVILDWVPAHFPRDLVGLACFDGTCVYEHKDPRQGSHPHWGTLIYNYGRPQVSNFLISNALYWAKKYHADGIRMDAVASMLYLDYGKNPGEWVANIYGGHENLEAVEFLKHLNSIFKKQSGGAMLIAEESTAWPQITGDVNEGSVGFDYKWNMGWMNDFLGYMQCDPYFRCGHYGELTFSMLYAYSENFILVLSHDEVVHGKASIAGKMPGETFEAKFSNLRAAYGFMMTHPGKKLLFMGQEMGQLSEWNENESLPWNLLEYDIHKQTREYVKALNHLYKSSPALYEMDYDPEGFQWIDCTSGQDNIVTFIRKTRKPEETLLVVCNFAPVQHDNYQVGVPFHGRYKEIFNSESTVFGGCGTGNPRAKTSKAEEWNGRDESIKIQLAPLGVHIFSCTPVKEAKKAPEPPKAAEAKKGAESKKTPKPKAAEEPDAGKKPGRKGKASGGQKTF
ncbi:MAG: 1,4-alpha-glucan branching protein GlgB [Hungatella sp.]|nr:1,4-alpha-glucan branching protein GlgB [Hungatella sp.]